MYLGPPFPHSELIAFYPQTKEKAERVGFEPTRRLNTAYAISNLKRTPYQFRGRRPHLTHCVRLVWPLAAFREVLIYFCVHCVHFRTGPVAVRLGIGCTLAFAAVVHLYQVRLYGVLRNSQRSETSRDSEFPCPPSPEELAHGQEQTSKRHYDEHDLVDVIFSWWQSAYEVPRPEHRVIS